MALSGFNTPTFRSQTPIERHLILPLTYAFSVLGVLSDMDGTLIDSTNAIVQHWDRIGRKYHIDPKIILTTSHGRRSIDAFQQIDPETPTGTTSARGREKCPGCLAPTPTKFQER
ncbi:DL-glycerol-3-phosphatase [Exophiala xenobiotica]|nr:DL-glycerol-3-phosphatase [Exophiala xenobiotica]